MGEIEKASCLFRAAMKIRLKVEERSCYIEGSMSEFRAAESEKPKRHDGEERKRRKKWQRSLSFLYVRDLLLLPLLHRKSSIDLLQNF